MEREWPQGDSIELWVQVDTSLEDSKNGIDYRDLDAIKAVVDAIEAHERTTFGGFMTIGARDDYDCFDRLKEVRSSLGKEDAGLSMGMSGDWEEAVKRGSTNIRCGTNIFGARDYSKAK